MKSIIFICVCACVCIQACAHATVPTCGSQRATCGSLISYYTMCVLEVELWLSGLRLASATELVHWLIVVFLILLII